MITYDVLGFNLLKFDALRSSWRGPWPMAAPSGHLTARVGCSTFVLMEVETLGVARSLGWKVHMRCANGYRQERGL